MILILVLTLLFGWSGVAVAQEAPAPVDPAVKLELIQKQNALLRRQNALLAQKIQLEDQVKKAVERLKAEEEAVAALQSEIQAAVNGLREGHEGWKLNQDLEWQKDPDKKDGGG